MRHTAGSLSNFIPTNKRQWESIYCWFIDFFLCLNNSKNNGDQGTRQRANAGHGGYSALTTARGYGGYQSHPPRLTTAQGYSDDDSLAVQLGGYSVLMTAQGYSDDDSSGVWGVPISPSMADDSSGGRGGTNLTFRLLMNPPADAIAPHKNSAPKQGASRAPMTSSGHLLTSADSVTFSWTLLAAILDLRTRPG